MQVNTQTSVMVKKPNRAEDDPEDLVWYWLPEDVEDSFKAKGDFTVSQLLEQNNVTGSHTDYLWYMTR